MAIKSRKIKTMKYIGTKDGKIYKALEDYMQSDLPPTKMRVEDVAKGWHNIIPKNKIIKQADTIEELIDEYVLREKANCKLCVDYAELTEDDLKLCLQDHDIFGAIWTDKGLIYVAKMNEKGELELL